MMTKLTYLPPESEPILITPTSPLCTSLNVAVADPGLADYELISNSDILWD